MRPGQTCLAPAISILMKAESLDSLIFQNLKTKKSLLISPWVFIWSMCGLLWTSVCVCVYIHASPTSGAGGWTQSFSGCPFLQPFSLQQGPETRGGLQEVLHENGVFLWIAFFSLKCGSSMKWKKRNKKERNNRKSHLSCLEWSLRFYLNWLPFFCCCSYEEPKVSWVKK